MITRRAWLLSGVPCLVGLAAGARFTFGEDAQSSFEDKVREIEKSVGGRLGVGVLDTTTGRRFEYRSGERFPMCSTFKLLAVGAVLQRVDKKKEDLARVIRYSKADLLAYAPVTEKHVDTGMSVEELCAAAITLSDNTAANLLLASLGGPAAVTAFARAMGDPMTRLDRKEPELNESAPGDPRDTSTPASMASDMKELVLGNVLSATSKAKLSGWLVGNKTGDARLRAGLPAGWKVGDKTGSGRRGSTNDVAIVWPPLRGAIVIAAYLTDTTGDDGRRNGALAAVGKLAAAL